MNLPTSCLFLAVLATALAPMAAPPNYYAAAEGKAGSELRAALHAIIRNHRAVPYASTSALDTSDALRFLDQNPANTNYVIEIYSGSNELASAFGTTTGWNREHLWCDSYGLDGIEPAYCDLHNLHAIDATVNSARGNKYYDTSDRSSPGYRFPAHAEAVLSSTDSDSWEPQPIDCGNIARSLFYMATRYTGDTHNEPTLILTDSTASIRSTNSYMGKLTTLFQWHAADPVDDAERLRNDRIHSLYQSNRNPFVDHPEWVNLTFAPPCTNRPTLKIAPTPTGCTLTWLATNQSARLEYATSFSATWQEAPVSPTLTNSQFLVRWTNTLPRAFFRLLTW